MPQLLNNISRSNWGLEKTKTNIAAHIDYLKFGKEDYGFGLGKIDICSRDSASTTKATAWGNNPTPKPIPTP